MVRPRVPKHWRQGKNAEYDAPRMEQAAAGEPVAPLHFAPQQRAKFNQVCGMMRTLGILSPHYQDVIENYVITFDRHRDAVMKAEKNTDHRERFRQSRLAMQYMAQLRLLAGDLGLTPTSLLRLPARSRKKFQPRQR